MSDSVKMVFKALLGTIMFMILTSLCIELFNVNVTGLQIRYISKLAARHAADLFTQETYKSADGGGTVNVANITDSSGATYITGKFYDVTSNATDTYMSIYGKDDSTQSFKKWCQNTSYSIKIDGITTKYEIAHLPNSKKSLSETYTNLEVLRLATDPSKVQSWLNLNKAPSWDKSNDDAVVQQWSRWNKALSFYETCYTPVNLGIPYLDAKITNRMFRWNLAMLLTGKDPDLIQTEADSEYMKMYGNKAINIDDKFINYKGFKIFADKAAITKYQYYVFDLANNSDREKYMNLTNNKVYDYRESGEGIKVNRKQSDFLGKKVSEFEAEDNYVAVVSITYEVPIEYIGITPIRSIFNYVWGQEVQGYGDHKSRTKNYQWATTKSKLQKKMTSGTTTEYMKTSDALFTTGYITYSIVN